MTQTTALLADQHFPAIIIGGGPAGLMAAEQLNQAGIKVELFEAMPTVGRKLLRAGIGGLNLTHSEAKADFIGRFGKQQATISKWLQRFDADDLRAWAKTLGIDTFVGSSGRVFPVEKKAAPLLRAWLKRLKSNGTQIHTRQRWLGWAEDGRLQFRSASIDYGISADVVIFALGGASWAKLGSDGQWAPLFTKHGINCVPFRPSNSGFICDWPAAFASEQQGQPLKTIGLSVTDPDGAQWYKKGDAVISTDGIEGSLIYGLSAPIRDRIEQDGHCTVYWDLLADKTEAQLTQALAKRRKGDSVTNVLRRQFKLGGAKLALLKVLTSKEQMQNLAELPRLLKQLPQRLTGCRPLDEAISTDGGVDFNDLTDGLMVKNRPGWFCVGEMLDWEAPTGGYLLTACYASGVVAGETAVQYLQAKSG